jgi:hypothetical protein
MFVTEIEFRSYYASVFVIYLQHNFYMPSRIKPKANVFARLLLIFTYQKYITVTKVKYFFQDQLPYVIT